MHSTILPNNAELSAEKNCCTFHPNGMLDRDQRTAVRIEKIQRDSKPLSSITSSTNNNQYHQNNSNGKIVTSNISEMCRNVSQIKDNNEIVPQFVLTNNLPKFDFNRARTKFPVACHVIAWIIFLTINITYIKAAPTIPITNENSPLTHFLNCEKSMAHAIEFNTLESNYSIELKLSMKNNPNLTKWWNDSSWDHYSNDLKNMKVEEVFSRENMTTEKDFWPVFKRTLNTMFDFFATIQERLEYHMCRHNGTLKNETKHIMGLKDYEQNDLYDYMKEMLIHVRQSITQLRMTSGEMNITTEFRDIKEKNCSLLQFPPTKAKEIITMNNFSLTSSYMNNFFNYINHRICTKIVYSPEW